MLNYKNLLKVSTGRVIYCVPYFRYFGPRRWLENALREPWNNNAEGVHGESNKSSKSQGGSGQTTSGGISSNPVSMNYNSPIWLSDEIEYWPDPLRNLKFTAISAMHSELIAIGTNGQGNNVQHFL